jgi:hypothetical protein
MRMQRAGAAAGRQTAAGPARQAAARPTWRARSLQQRQPKQPAPRRSRVQYVRACAYSSGHTSGGRELRRVRVASRRVGLVDVLWHDFHQSPSRRPEQRGQLQWPSRVHLCGGGATTAAETTRWRRVGTRVDWSSIGCCMPEPEPPRLGGCIARPLGSGQLQLGLLSPFRHLQSANVVDAQMCSRQILIDQYANATERRGHLGLKRRKSVGRSAVFTSGW